MHNFNTFILMFGLNPDDYSSDEAEPIKTDKGWIINLKQSTSKDKRICPSCGSNHVQINDYNTIEYSVSSNMGERSYARIRKVRFKCMECKTTFTNPLTGIVENSSLTEKTLSLMKKSFTEMLTYEQIGRMYDLTDSRVIQLFDKLVPHVPRRPLPKYLCIDEVKLETEYGKYVVILSDYESGEVIDVLKSRQDAYLREYFNSISLKERQNVKFLISDMYDEYESIRLSFFKGAPHLIDMFHIVKQLTEATNRLRVRSMNNILYQGTFGHDFMKSKWKLFLLRNKDIPDKEYTSMIRNKTYTYPNMVQYCLNECLDLYKAYSALQDLYCYPEHKTYTDAANFVDFLVNKLRGSENELLEKVADTYTKWKNEIATTFSQRYKEDKYFTNAVAEGNNSKFGTLVKIAYGFHNFERTRKRFLLIKTYTYRQPKSEE